MGRFDYPSPYWDSVGDPALDLIDRMLTVDADKRYTVDQCLQHPWTLNNFGKIKLNDSTDGLVDRIGNLDFSKRKVARERTLLSTLNDIQISQIIDLSPKNQMKIYDKNPQNKAAKKGEATPSKERNTEEFVKMGGKGDQPLFGYDGGSNYSPQDVAKNGKKAAK